MKRKASYFKIFLLGFGFFGLSILWSLYNSDIPIMLKNVYSMSYTASGWVMNLDNILAITLIPLVGFWSDHLWTRIGRRMPFIISTLPIGGLLFALVPWIPLWLGTSATSLAAFILVLFFVNICMGISRSPIIALMPDLVPPEERSPANGVINFMGGFGSLLVYFVVGKISTTNRPLGFAIAGASVLVAAVIMFLSIKETRDSLDRKAPQSEHADFSLLRRMWTPKYRSLLLICLAIFFWFIAFNAIETYYPTYMHAESPAVRDLITRFGTAIPTDAAQIAQLDKARQASEASAKFNLGVFSLAFMLLSIPAGFIGKRLGRKTTILIGLAGVIIMVLLLAFGIATTAGLTIFVMGGLSWALVNINSLPTVLDMGNLEMVGALTGIYYFFSQAASIVSPPLVGRIADLAGGTMSVMFPYAGIFFVLAAVCMLFMRPEDKPAVSSDNGPAV
ncbi:MAG: MFS transporter [Coprothermobacter sp.]|jgi:MFS family permease|nr:MFS transporter [Coprothermobacter sp.]